NLRGRADGPVRGRSQSHRQALSRQPDAVLPFARPATDRRRSRELGAAPARAPRRDEGGARADGGRGRTRDHRLIRARLPFPSVCQPPSPSTALLTRILTATRRFCALPCGVELSATGSASDMPVGVSIRHGAQPHFCCRWLTTRPARRSLSTWLESSSPSASV